MLGQCGLSEIYLVTKQVWAFWLPLPFNARFNASSHNIVRWGQMVTRNLVKHDAAL